MENRLNNSIRAFTLIELLVVVAILVILASIATFNFLEAQTRAKVSRSKADLRTMGMALEMHYVDNSSYPPDNSVELLNNLSPLVIPIAYISSLPEDVFAKTIQMNYEPIDWSIIYKSNGRLVRPYTFDYLLMKDFAIDGSYDYLTNGRPEIKWALRGVGPDKLPVWLDYEGVVHYDPTNGTISAGIILHMGPGV